MITVASQLDAQRLALPAYLPTPTLGMLFFPGREDIVIGGARMFMWLEQAITKVDVRR